MASNTIRPFIINSNLCTSMEDVSNYATFMDSIAGNTGNSYITWSLLKEIGCTIEQIKGYNIKNIYSYNFEKKQEEDIDIINNECTNVILVLQDQIRIRESYNYRLPFSKLEYFLSKVKKPLLVAGLGSNSLEGYVPNFHLKLDCELIKFLKFISNTVHTIGVRGYYTEEILHNLGIDNVTVIGCPSYYEMGMNRIITKPKWNDSIRIGASTGINDNRIKKIYLQDCQLGEAQIIKSIAFNNYSLFDNNTFEDIINKKYRIFSSITKWKQDLSDIDFYCGYRVHGSMVALNSLKPTVVVNIDSRSREMCEYMNIPYHPEYNKASDLSEVFTLCDYAKMNDEYNAKLKKYIDFLKSNAIIYNPIPQQVGEIDLKINELIRAKKVTYVNRLIRLLYRQIGLSE